MKAKKKTERERRTPRQLERHLKGAANHHRIGILLLIAENPRITVDGIAEELVV